MSEFKLTYELDVQLQEGDLEKVVKTIHWRYAIIDGEYTDDVYGSILLSSPDGDFIPFDELTDDDIRSWLFDKEDFSKKEKVLIAKMEETLNPKIVRLELSN